jgi:hypothetical protein
MRSPDQTYKFNKEQLLEAQSIIQKEKRDTLEGWRKRAYLVFNISVYAFIALFLIEFFIFIYMDVISDSLLAIISILFGLVTLVLIVSFIINIPLFKSLRRRMRILNRVGAFKIKDIRKVREKGFKRFVAVTTRFSFIIGIIFMIMAALAVIGILAPMTEEGQEVRTQEYIFSIIGLIVSVLAGISLIMNHYLRLHKRRLQRVQELESSLKMYQESSSMDSENVDIPVESYDKIVRLEQDQISYDRMDTLLALEDQDLKMFSLLKSKKVQEAIETMNSKDKLEITDQITELTMDPEAKGIITDPETQQSHIDMSGSNIRIEFKIDKENRIVNVLNINKETSSNA